MTYAIDWTSKVELAPGLHKKPPIELIDKTFDSTSTSLILTGKGVKNYGEMQQENFVKLLENFASATSPLHPTVGQLWFNTLDNLLYAYTTANVWEKSGGGASSLSLSSIVAALGYTPYNGTTNPNAYLSAGNASVITTALGYFPVNKAGDTMVGALTLNGDPVNALHAATKQYVDNHSGNINLAARIVAGTNITIDQDIPAVGDITINSTGGTSGVVALASRMFAGPNISIVADSPTVGDVTISATAPASIVSGIPIINGIGTQGTGQEGDIVWDSTTEQLYIWHIGQGWVLAISKGNGIRTVADLNAAGTGTEGDMVYNNADGKLYVWHSGAWVASVSSSNGIPVVSSIPTEIGIDGEIKFNSGDGQLYVYHNGWVAAIPGSGISSPITTTQIADNSITTPKIAANAITTGKIAANAITAGTIAAGTIAATDIAANAITAGKIAVDAVTAGTIAASSITATKIATDAITSDKIMANAITSGKILAGSIDATKIVAGTITANEIAAGTITGTKIAAGTITGDKIVVGSLTADLIDTRGLTVKDALGNIILSAGTPLTSSYLAPAINTAIATAGSNATAAASAASAAQSTANTANSNAATAQSTANTANSNAATAQAAATSAAATAASAASSATAANNALAGKLSKSGADTMVGPISLGASTAILVGTTNDGLYLGNTGIVGRKAGATTFSIDQVGNATFGGTLNAATGTFAGTISGGSLVTGAFTGYAWPTAGNYGSYLGPSGLLIGNANNAKYLQVTYDGNIYAPGFQVVNGTLSISQLNVIGTSNIANNSVTEVYIGTSNGAASTSVLSSFNFSIPAGQTWSIMAFALIANMTASAGNNGFNSSSATVQLKYDGVVVSSNSYGNNMGAVSGSPTATLLYSKSYTGGTTAAITLAAVIYNSVVSATVGATQIIIIITKK